MVIQDGVGAEELDMAELAAEVQEKAKARVHVVVRIRQGRANDQNPIRTREETQIISGRRRRRRPSVHEQRLGLSRASADARREVAILTASQAAGVFRENAGW